MNYFGNLPTETAIKTYGARPILLVAAEDDAESAAAVRRLNALAAGGKHEIKIYQKGGHGTGILSTKVGLDKLFMTERRTRFIFSDLNFTEKRQ